MHSLCQRPFPPPDSLESSLPPSSYSRRKVRTVAFIFFATAFVCLGLGHLCLVSATPALGVGSRLSTLDPRPAFAQPSCFATFCGEPLLSQLPAPDPAHFTNWLVSATAALSIMALGKQFVRKTPLEAQFLTRKEFADFREKLDQDLNGISGKIDRSHDLLSHRLDVLSVRMDEVRSLVDRVDERTKHPERDRRTTGTT